MPCDILQIRFGLPELSPGQGPGSGRHARMGVIHEIIDLRKMDKIVSVGSYQVFVDFRYDDSALALGRFNLPFFAQSEDPKLQKPLSSGGETSVRTTSPIY